MIAGASARWLLGFWLSLGLLVPALRAHAQDQFVLVDETYTATSANTMDSHYRVDPHAATPSNWRAPIDYASGKVHARLDVIAKPSSKKTLYNICFEATPSYACMPYAMYSTTGVVEIEFPFSSFYQYNDVDWSKGVRDIALILKDENQTKMQGSPDFYPTTIHATITVIKPGATYVPPADVMMDAGMPEDAGAAQDAGEPKDAGGTRDAGRPVAADAGKPKPPADAGNAGSGAAGMAGTSAAAGSAAGAPATPATQPPPMMVTQPVTSGVAGASAAGSGSSQQEPRRAVGGCALTHGSANVAGCWLLALLLGLRRRKHKRS